MHVASLRSRFRTLSVTASGAVLALMLGGDAAGFNLDEGGSWSGQPSLPIRVQLGAPATLGSSSVTYPLQDGNPSFNESFLQAARFWNHYLAGPGPGPVITPTVQATGDGGNNDGINTIFFSSTVYGSGFGTGVLAVTIWNGPVGTSTGMDIIFNNARKWDSYRGDPHFNGTQLIVDFQRVAIHELGHLLGIDHPDDATPPQFVNAIMNSSVGGTDIMQDDDIKGINVLYNNDPLPGTPGTLGTLTNLSTRLNVQTGASIGIAGLIISGTGTKRVIIRAIGPSLTALGVPGALQAPSLQLFDAHNPIKQNTGWKTNTAGDQAIIQGAGLAPTVDAECAIVMDLPAGGYTAQMSGVGGTTGVGLVEVFDIDPTNTAAKLSNVATRGQIQTNANVMIGGFIIGGTLPKHLAIRAIGPSLTQLGVSGAIADPTLTIFDAGQNRVYFNDNWQSSQSQMIGNSGYAPGFAAEGAVIINLLPGAYTVILQGVNNTTGNGRVDIFDLDP